MVAGIRQRFKDGRRYPAYRHRTGSAWLAAVPGLSFREGGDREI